MARRRMNVGRKIKDEPVKTKTNRGARPERRPSRQPAGRMGPPMPMPAAPKPPAADMSKVDMKPTKPKVDASVTPKPTSTPVTKRPKVTGKGSRDVVSKGPMGERRLANVTAEQLKAAGLTGGPKGLRTYLNMYDKLGRRPKPSDFKKGMGGDPTRPRRTGSARPMKERKFMAGGMKSKMGTKGGAMGGKKKMAPGMMGGGMMKSKMSTKGGTMGGKKKAPGYKAGKTVGSKFPDLSGDGKVTQKDILMGKGVIKKKGGGKVKPKGAAAGGGYKKGGMKPKGAAAGGGYKKGGMKTKTATKKRVSKPKVRGAGIARKGVRPVKFR